MLNRVSSKLCGHVRCIYDWVNIVVPPHTTHHLNINLHLPIVDINVPQMFTINIDTYLHFKICIGSVCAHCHRIKSIKKNVVLEVVSQI